MWMKIEHLPEHVADNQMFVVKGFDVVRVEGYEPYTTDPYCVWLSEGVFMRWPHSFMPTHFCLLPEEKE